MNLNSALERIAHETITETREDYVGLWSVLWQVRHAFPNYSPEQAREATMLVLRSILQGSEIIVGSFQGQRFVPWFGSSRDWLDRIAREWDALGKDPNIGDIAWFSVKSRSTQDTE